VDSVDINILHTKKITIATYFGQETLDFRNKTTKVKAATIKHTVVNEEQAEEKIICSDIPLTAYQEIQTEPSVKQYSKYNSCLA